MKQYVYNHAGALTGLWGLVIFALCAVPGRYIPTTSWLELLSFDKLVHAGMFFILCSLLILNAAKKRGASRTDLRAVFICIVYGAGLELMQAYIFIERSMDYLDAIANSVGAVVAFGLRGKLKAAMMTEADYR